MTTLQNYFSSMLSKLKRTPGQKMSDLYVLNWKSLYEIVLFMCQSRQQHFVEF